MRHRVPGAVLWAMAGAVLVFLYLPVVVIIVQSFNASSIVSFPIDQWTTRWYSVAASDEVMVSAARNSVIVALASIAIALVIGVPAALGLDRHEFRGKALFMRALFLPFLIPGIITGIALLSMFLFFDVQLSLRTIIVGHTTMLIPVVVILMFMSLQRWDREIEAAAMDLGASEFRTFAHVTLPNLKSTIAGIILLGFTFSLDEVTRTFFLAGTENTLPMAIWGMLRRGITPEVNAVATVVLGVSLIAIAAWSRLSRDLL